MCDKRNSVRITLEDRVVRVDNCMKGLILKLNRTGYKTLACCCGHGRYQSSVVIEEKDGSRREMNSEQEIPREKRFYVTDEEGFYFIPEAGAER